MPEDRCIGIRSTESPQERIESTPTSAQINWFRADGMCSKLKQAVGPVTTREDGGPAQVPRRTWHYRSSRTRELTCWHLFDETEGRIHKSVFWRYVWKKSGYAGTRHLVNVDCRNIRQIKSIAAVIYLFKGSDAGFWTIRPTANRNMISAITCLKISY